jgi:hypothetical protein
VVFCSPTISIDDLNPPCRSNERVVVVLPTIVSSRTLLVLRGLISYCNCPRFDADWPNKCLILHNCGTKATFSSKDC